MNTAERPAAKKRRGTYLGRTRGFSLYPVRGTHVTRCIRTGKQAAGVVWPASKPVSLDWPIEDDAAGASAMVIAMDGNDVETLLRMKAQFPGHVFGFESWLEELQQTHPRRVRNVRTVQLPLGHALDVTLLEEHDGRVRVRLTLRRDKVVLATEIAATINDFRDAIARDADGDDADDDDSDEFTTDDDDPSSDNED